MGKQGKKIDDAIYKSVSKMVISECRAEYDELCSTWSSLDTKAQGTVAISSALLAGLLIFLRFQSEPGLVVLALIIIAISLIVSSLIWALCALLIREVSCMDGAGPVLDASEDILGAESDEVAKERLRSFVRELANRWQKINSDLHSENNRKSHRVAKAQQYILAGVLATGTAILVSLLQNVESALCGSCL